MVHLNIGILLERSGKSKYWLVNQLDTNYTVVNKMLNDETTQIRFETIDKLCELFDCSPGDLFIRK